MYTRCMYANVMQSGCGIQGTIVPYATTYDCTRGDYVAFSGASGMNVCEPPVTLHE